MGMTIKITCRALDIEIETFRKLVWLSSLSYYSSRCTGGSLVV